METVWKNVKTALKDRVSSNIYRLWIEPIHYVKKNGDDTLVLGCPNFFIKKRIMANYAGLINKELSREAGKEMSISLSVQTADKETGSNGNGNGNGNGSGRGNGNGNGNRREKSEAGRQLYLPGISAQPANGRILRRDYTFDSFVVGR
ncbi:MAG: hypothetical protein KGY38_06820, partial [Desulfobacterales bacterium]|nr:hypothetical protein [Desulfobacterales bacterium]